MRSAASTLLVGLLVLAGSLSACSQSLMAENSVGSSPSTPVSSAASPSTEGPATMHVRGIVKCPEGPLPGAVVHLNGTKTYVVTDAQGNFELEILVGSPPIEVTCSYAGFRDVVQRMSVKNGSVLVVQLKETTKLPPRDRTAETSWW